MILSTKKIGILGGGQLGKMLCIAAAPWQLELHVLDRSREFPASPYCHYFTEGDFTSFDDVIHFGKDLDILTIEIESVNLDALKELKKMGKEVFPDPGFLEIVKDKGLQNKFYRENNIPTPRFSSFDSKNDLIQSVDNGEWKLPLVWKSRFEGYDGRGVRIIHRQDELEQLPETPCIAEEKVEINKELAIIVSRNTTGEKAIYDPVEMVFDPGANLLDYLICPAGIDQEVENEMRDTAAQLVDEVDFKGLLAIEFFLDSKGRLLINEMAPRPHNSGHHTIECCPCSQYEQLLRAIMGLPPGGCRRTQSGVMFNLLGSPDHSGPAILQGGRKLMEMNNAHLHWYGKKETRPFRKMGHVVVAGPNERVLFEKANFLKKQLKVTT